MDFLAPLDIKSERQLIARGTKNALDKLALHNMAEAVKYAQRCSGGNLSENELISMCWVALRQAAEKYRQRKSGGIRFFAFAKVYLRSQVSEEWQQNAVVKKAEEIVEIDNSMEKTVEPDFSHLETQELLAGLRPALFSQLNDRERAILILRYESGFSFTEIGERIGFSRQSIQKVHAKALKKLRSVLEPKKEQLL